MKLINCLECKDVVRLIHTKWRNCECGKSGGQYNDDLITATIGGKCRVFGIPNTFFYDEFYYLTDEGKEWYRKKIGYGSTDAWYGETKGDKQIFRIEANDGKRLKVKVVRHGKNSTKTIIVDKRDYVIDGEKNCKFVICENYLPPNKKKIK